MLLLLGVSRQLGAKRACRWGRFLAPATTKSQDPMGRVRARAPRDFLAKARV